MSSSSATSATTTGKPGRNETCGCGSGKKYKKCCLVQAARARDLRVAQQEQLLLQQKPQRAKPRAPTVDVDEYPADLLPELEPSAAAADPVAMVQALVAKHTPPGSSPAGTGSHSHEFATADGVIDDLRAEYALARGADAALPVFINITDALTPDTLYVLRRSQDPRIVLVAVETSRSAPVFAARRPNAPNAHLLDVLVFHLSEYRTFPSNMTRNYAASVCGMLRGGGAPP